MRIGSSPEADAEAVGGVSALAASAAAWRSHAGRDRSCGDRGAQRSVLPGGRRPALRTRTLDGVCRRGLVALAHDAAVDPIAATNFSGGRRCAGSRPDALRSRDGRPFRRRSSPETRCRVDVEVRDRAFVPVPDATVTATLTVTRRGSPSRLRSGTRPAAAVASRRRSARSARALSGVTPMPGRGTTSLGTGGPVVLVGGGDREFADPRLNEGLLRRIARQESGGRYVRAADRLANRAWLQIMRATHARARRARSVARALGIRARHRASFRRMDPPQALGPAMTVARAVRVVARGEASSWPRPRTWLPPIDMR